MIDFWILKIIILDFTTPFVKNAKTPYFGSDENSRNDHKNRFFLGKFTNALKISEKSKNYKSDDF